MTAELAILAGGLATRLGDRTRTIPKSLLLVHGRPFVAWQLERVRDSGFSKVLLCVGHLGEQIESFVGDGRAFGLHVEYSHDGGHLLGTGGALVKALPQLAECFVVTYGDSYLPFDYRAPLRDLLLHPEAEGCLAVYPNENRWDSSNTRVSGERVVAYRKNARDFDHIDYGALALRRSALAAEGRSAFGLDSVQTALAERGTLRAFIAGERFYEVGSDAGIRDFEAYLSSHRPAY
ncbi:MAG TPA: NTP transferase domain-containing protein [Polyangiaceae bacterium]|nr:NTP transferase domain-containing protein [Polyangiaceae bacterium]